MRLLLPGGGGDRGRPRRPLTMDAHGARHLRFRIEQQHQWRAAEAVRSGLQAATDPDLHRLERIGDRVRDYRPEAGRGPARKRLVEGWWQVAP